MDRYRNAYRPPPPDLTHTPQSVRDALDRNIPIRPGEMVGRAITMQRMANVPNARVMVQYVAAAGADPATFSVRILDYTGRADLAQFDGTPDQFAVFLRGALEAYRRSGGDPETLLQHEE